MSGDRRTVLQKVSLPTHSSLARQRPSIESAFQSLPSAVAASNCPRSLMRALQHAAPAAHHDPATVALPQEVHVHPLHVNLLPIAKSALLYGPMSDSKIAQHLNTNRPSSYHNSL